MKKKILYTAFFILCMHLYATSKEFSATGKKEEITKQANIKAIKEKQVDKETAAIFPLVYLFHAIS